MSTIRNNKKKNSNRTKIMYNKKNLNIKTSDTIIVVDWDDTLFPTSWIVENGIDLTDPKSRYKYMKYFEHLDENLSSLLDYMKTLGEVIIITNAMPEWIELSVSVLPKTKRCLENIEVVSARKKYQTLHNMSEWKKYTFLEEISKRAHKKSYNNILSLGDAEFEHNALINLYNQKIIPHKYLKSIKFIKSSDYNILLEQIKMMRLHIKHICSMTRQVDLIFDTS